MSLILKILTSWNCNLLDSVSPQQKFEVTDRLVLQLSFIWQAKENVSSRREGGHTQKKQREEKPGTQFWLLFLYIFSPLPEPALCKLGQPGGLFVLPEALTLIFRFCFVLFFTGFFPSLSFSHRHSRRLFPILTT